MRATSSDESTDCRYPVLQSVVPGELVVRYRTEKGLVEHTVFFTPPALTYSSTASVRDTRTQISDTNRLGAIAAIPAGQSVVVGGEIPYLPEALAKREENRAGWPKSDPEAKCYMVGVPRITYMPYPFQIMQTAEQVTILYEYVHTFRNIYIDSEHPPGPIQWWMGDSRAHWEGDTLVVLPEGAVMNFCLVYMCGVRVVG